MTNEQFQDLILAKLEQLDTKFDKRMDSFEQRMDSVDQHLVILDQRMNSSEQRMETVEQQIAILNQKVDNLPTREELHAIVAEQQQDVVGLLEINLKTAKRLEAKIDIIQQRIFENEADIQLLKRAR
ncbi:MAG: hypothetical protein E6X17_10925 [Sporomusaceae bacterium]|nr:hypothetical protein [Sporomusaceae bacterium]